MGRIFAHWMHGNIRPIWGNFEGRWIFQVTLIKMDFIIRDIPEVSNQFVRACEVIETNDVLLPQDFKNGTFS